MRKERKDESMSDITFNCPNCEQPLEIPDELLGQTVDCPSCQGSIELPKPEAPPQPKQPDTPAPSRTPLVEAQLIVKFLPSFLMNQAFKGKGDVSITEQGLRITTRRGDDEVIAFSSISQFQCRGRWLWSPLAKVGIFVPLWILLALLWATLRGGVIISGETYGDLFQAVVCLAVAWNVVSRLGRKYIKFKTQAQGKVRMLSKAKAADTRSFVDALHQRITTA